MVSTFSLHPHNLNSEEIHPGLFSSLRLTSWTAAAILASSTFIVLPPWAPRLREDGTRMGRSTALLLICLLLSNPNLLSSRPYSLPSLRLQGNYPICQFRVAVLTVSLGSHDKHSSLVLQGSTGRWGIRVPSPVFSWILLQLALNHRPCLTCSVFEWGDQVATSLGKSQEASSSGLQDSYLSPLSSTASHPGPLSPARLLTETLSNPPQPLLPQPPLF